MPTAAAREASVAAQCLAIGSALLAIPGVYGPLFGVGFLLEDFGDASWRQLAVSAALLLVSGVGYGLLVGYWRGVMRGTVSLGRVFWIVSAAYNVALLALLGFPWMSAASDSGPHHAWFALFAAWLLFATAVSVRSARSSVAPSRSCDV